MLFNNARLPTRADIKAEQDRRACKKLSEFAKRAWHVLEPTTPLKWGWSMDAVCEHLEAVTSGNIRSLLINIPPGCLKSLLVGVLFPAWEWGPKGLSHLRYLGTAHKQDLAIRDNMKCRRLVSSKWFQDRWPIVLMNDNNAKLRFENSATGFREAMAFTSMTGSRGDRVILDDPLSVDDADSEAALKAAELTFTEALPTRVNSEQSAKIVIMQRLHERDTSGVILSRALDYVHLMLPMEFEPERRCVTSIGFSDPRKAAGELLFPERFGPEQVADLKRTMGSYACTPAESPVLMADLSLRPISLVKPGDMIVGFAAGEVAEGAGYARQRLRPAKVLDVFSRRAKVVKMTLDSGEVIRCTPDHKWYRRQRNDRGGAGSYGPASVGTKLTRVCPACMPELSADQQRLAGWVAGFYDADGSVSFHQRHQNCKPVAQIKFYQGAGRNGPLCEKLEQALQEFGFDYWINSDTRKDPKRGVNFEYRCYTVSGQALPTMQRFLHIIQPTKWRERIIEGAFAAKFRTGFERVVSIEDDGEEDVFSLKTETGNYVVWGLASSNCAGQFQQRPAPRDGGRFKRQWFEVVDALPANRRRVRRWDFAGTEATQGTDPDWTVGLLMSVANGVYYVEDVVRDRCSPAGVETMVRNTATADGKGVPIRIPQDPGAAGKSVALSFVKALAGWDIRAKTETGSKTDRARPLEAQAEAGNVKLLRGHWNQVFLDELCVFPGGAHDDQVDAASGAFAELLETPPTPLFGTYGND